MSERDISPRVSGTRELDVRLAQIREFRLNYVGYLNHFALRSGSLHSDGYCDCCGLVLLTDDAIALSHYDLSFLRPRQYVPQVLEELSKHSSPDGAEAVVIGGARGHFNALKREMETRRIPVVAEYCDSWGRKCRESKSVGIDFENRLVILKAGERPARTLYKF